MVQNLDPQSSDVPTFVWDGMVELSPQHRVTPSMVREDRAPFRADLALGEPIEKPEMDAGKPGRRGAKQPTRSVLMRITMGAALIALLLLAVSTAAVALSGATYFYQVSHHLRQP